MDLLGTLGAAANVIALYDFFAKLGLRFRGSPCRHQTKPHYRLGQWPEIGRHVVGRDDLTGLIADQLGNRRIVAIVKGQGGIGKTTLARHYIERSGDRYHGVLWVQAQDETSLIGDLTLLAAASEVRGLELMEPKQRARACLDAVAAANQDWLIVFDNAPDEAALANWRVKGDRVRILVTSRNTFWSSKCRTISPDALPTGKRSDAGPVLLMQEAGRQDDADGALELARELGGLPLALVAAGGLIREGDGSFGDYREKLAKVLKEVPAGDYGLSVIGAVKLSYDALDDDARAVLDLLAWYSPEGLEARLLTDVPSYAFLDYLLSDMTEEVLALCSDADRVESAMAALVRRSLLVRTGESCNLHRMSAASVRALQEMAGRRDAAARAAAAVLAAAYPVRPQDSENWPACARSNPHVLALHRVLTKGEDDPLTGPAPEYLFNRASIYLRAIAEPAPALALAETSLQLKQARLPENHPELAAGWSVLGLAQGAAGKLAEAVAAQAENVRLCKLHDLGAEALASAQGNYAGALRELGQATGNRALLENARDADQAALALRREVLDEESELVANSLTSLAMSHNALGNVAQARDLSLQALAIWRKVLPPGDARLGFPLNNAGSDHLMLGEAGAALPLLTEALALRRAVYGRLDHPNALNTAAWLVSCLMVLARRDLACAGEAQRIAAEFGLDWEAHQRFAMRYPGPVDPPQPPG